MSSYGSKVLLVEDSRSINGLVSRSIRNQLHIDVVSATSMQEAKQILEIQPDDFFVAILDLNLPDAPDGEVVQCVMSYGVPPIILTGSMSDNLHDEMMDKPIIDYVIKRNLNEIEYVIDLVKRLHDNRNRKALVVDDSRSSRLLLASLLERHYFNVFTAADGEEALEVLAEHEDIILIVTDCNMPKMDGIELTTKVRTKYTRNELAILGISTSGGGTTSVKFLKAGANDFITRPFLHEEFYCRVNQNIDAISSYCTLRDTADLDFLTGLYNRKYLFNTGNKLFENAKRGNITLTTAMIDIDHFKAINDTHGHQVGDLVLKHVADIFKQQLREADVIARIGGEEFCLMCVNANQAQSEELLTRFLYAIQFNPLQINDIKIAITISIGYSMSLDDTLDEMINNADAALYKAKENGRNQIVISHVDEDNYTLS
ncbi:MAG: diguanylate cyclase [Pseudomonadales bacterium]